MEVSGIVDKAAFTEIDQKLHHFLEMMEGEPSLWIDVRDVAVAPEADEPTMKRILEYITSKHVNRVAIIFTTSTQILNFAKVVNDAGATEFVRYFSPIFRSNWETFAIKWIKDGKCPITYREGSGAYPALKRPETKS